MITKMITVTVTMMSNDTSQASCRCVSLVFCFSLDCLEPQPCHLRQDDVGGDYDDDDDDHDDADVDDDHDDSCL